MITATTILKFVFLLLAHSTITIVMTTAETSQLPPEEDITSTIATTIPDGCQGQTKSHDDPCTFCQCVNWTGQWEWQCVMVTCPMALCYDSTLAPGDCCRSCPNGPNCEYNGVLIPSGEFRQLDNGLTCYCEQPWVTCEPTTSPSTTTTTTTTCEPEPNGSPCVNCMCVDYGGHMEHVCAWMSCKWLPCVDPYTPQGECCPKCPNGPNCVIEGVIVAEGEVHQTVSGDSCFCEINTNEVKVACQPASSTSTTPTPTTGSCDPGSVDSGNPCEVCHCDGPMRVCYVMDCMPPSCVDYVNAGCCSVCPNGSNCEAYGVIIPINETRTFNDSTICGCRQDYIYTPPYPVCTPIVPSTTTTTNYPQRSTITKDRSRTKNKSKSKPGRSLRPYKTSSPSKRKLQKRPGFERSRK